MDKIQAYRRAIQILAGTIDFKELVYKIARNAPEVLVDLYDEADLNRIANVYTTNGKIPAIREYRFVFNSTLKEAKDAVEALAVERKLDAPQRT